MPIATVKRPRVPNKINVLIDREVWRLAKIAALQDDRFLAELIEEAIRDALNKRNNKTRT